MAIRILLSDNIAAAATHPMTESCSLSAPLPSRRYALRHHTILVWRKLWRLGRPILCEDVRAASARQGRVKEFHHATAIGFPVVVANVRDDHSPSIRISVGYPPEAIVPIAGDSPRKQTTGFGKNGIWQLDRRGLGISRKRMPLASLAKIPKGGARRRALPFEIEISISRRRVQHRQVVVDVSKPVRPNERLVIVGKPYAESRLTRQASPPADASAPSAAVEC